VEFEAAVVDRVVKAEAVRVEELAVETWEALRSSCSVSTVTSALGVLWVTDYRVANGGEVNAELMGAPGSEPCFYESCW
jgi:hypothetical protein